MPSPRRAPVQARSKQRVERVLRAAEQVFSEVGFVAATTNQIAVRAGTSIGSIYEFFANKQAIAEALSERYLSDFARLDDRLAADTSGSDRVLSSLVDLVHAFHVRHPGLTPLLSGGQGSEDLQATEVAIRAHLVQLLDRFISLHRGSFDLARQRLVAETAAGILWSLVGEVALGHRDERDVLLAELKLVLASYLSAALPRSSPAAPVGMTPDWRDPEG